MFFATTGCFNLDVELVELLNEMIDNFRQLSTSMEVPRVFQFGSHNHGAVAAAFEEVESSDQWRAIQRGIYTLRVREMELHRLTAEARKKDPSDLTAQAFVKAYDSDPEVVLPVGDPGLSNRTIVNPLELQVLFEPPPKKGAM